MKVTGEKKITVKKKITAEEKITVKKKNLKMQDKRKTQEGVSMGLPEFEKTGILGCSEDYYENALSAPSYFTDLNLDQIIARIAEERRNYDLKRYFYRLPQKRETAQERCRVLRALENKELFDGFLRFSDGMLAARGYAERYRKAEFGLQRQRFLLDCGAAYTGAVQELVNALAAAGADGRKDGRISSSALLCGLGGAVTGYTGRADYREFAERTAGLSQALAELRVQMALSRDRVKISQEETKGSYAEKLKRLFPAQVGRTEELENPFQAEKEPGKFERLVLESFRKSRPELFDRLRDYEKDFSRELPQAAEGSGRAENFMTEWLLALERQLQVYLAYRLFMDRTAKSGYPFAYPEFSGAAEDETEGIGTDRSEACIGESAEGNLFCAAECYDLALLLKSLYSRQVVVCNNVRYGANEAFLVVTGPNQGGKTTFARSVGQMVYFSLMGLAAPCRQLRLPFFDGILTHFSVEESLETGRGKLKEELVRLEPMMRDREQNKFVVINELFTTAATYDAYIMGRRVMEHFLRQSCLGIYVTHIQELADEDQIHEEGKRIVSLSACVDDSDSHIRTYKIVRKPAEGTGYAYGLVEKYRMTYPELKVRLKERLGEYRER